MEQPHSVVFDVTDADFKRQVIQRSYKTPVLVDFWATWCGPCQVLDPILISLAEDPDSGFVLAKLDTESNPKTTRQYHVQSIPTVKMFRNGQAVDEFHGMRPAGLVKRFVDRSLAKAPPAVNITGDPAPDNHLAQAKKYLAQGRGFEAFVLLNDFPESPQQIEAEQLLPVANFLYDMELGDLFSGSSDLNTAYEMLAKNLRKRNYDEALKQLAAINELAGEKNGIDLPAFEEGITVLSDGR